MKVTGQYVMFVEAELEIVRNIHLSCLDFIKGLKRKKLLVSAHKRNYKNRPTFYKMKVADFIEFCISPTLNDYFIEALEKRFNAHFNFITSLSPYDKRYMKNGVKDRRTGKKIFNIPYNHQNLNYILNR